MNRKEFAVIFIVFFTFIYVCFINILLNILYPIKYYDTINHFCSEYNVDKCLVLSTIKSESNFNVKSVSNVGAVGLMQLMPDTALYISNKIGKSGENLDLFDYKTNIELGVAYLSYLQNKFSDIDVIICAYNAGEGEILNWLDEEGKLKEIKYDETKNYLIKVKQSLNVYNERLRYFKY